MANQYGPLISDKFAVILDDLIKEWAEMSKAKGVNQPPYVRPVKDNLEFYVMVLMRQVFGSTDNWPQ